MDPTFSPDEAKWHPPAPTQQHNGGRATDGHSGQRGRRGWGMTHHSNRYLGPGGRHLSPTLHSVIQKKIARNHNSSRVLAGDSLWWGRHFEPRLTQADRRSFCNVLFGFLFFRVSSLLVRWKEGYHNFAFPLFLFGFHTSSDSNAQFADGYSSLCVRSTF